MKKHHVNVILLVLFGSFILIVSFIQIARNIDLNLRKQNVITGKVTAAKTMYIKDGKYSHRYIYFTLHNSNQEFIIQTLPSYPTDLVTSISVDDTLTVYFRPTTGYNKHVFQIEKNGKVLADYETYNKSKSVAAFIGLVVGISLLIHAFFLYKGTNLTRVLNSLVK